MMSLVFLRKFFTYVVYFLFFIRCSFLVVFLPFFPSQNYRILVKIRFFSHIVLPWRLAYRVFLFLFTVFLYYFCRQRTVLACLLLINYREGRIYKKKPFVVGVILEKEIYLLDFYKLAIFYFLHQALFDDLFV